MGTTYNMIDLFKNALIKLDNMCQKNDFRGYSLYDSHTSPLPLEKLGHRLSFLINQFVKRSPVNIRKLIGVKKNYNPKGMGLFLHAYTLQKKLGNPLDIENLDDRITFFFNWLKDNYSQGYSGHCWGYNYPWPKSDRLLVPSFTPSSVVTGFNIRAIFQYYLLTKDDICLNLIQGAERFILNDIPRTENERGICFAYTPLKRDVTINANLLAAEILAYSDFVFDKTDNQEIISKVFDFTMAHQNSDGSWYYSFEPETGRPKKQLDFHQGYVLETIKRICDYTEINISEYDIQLKSGLAFYRENQFTDAGLAYWRIPKKWPVDIHNLSQGIITFSLFKDYDSEYLNFARKIAKWTIENMQDSKGNFYYQKWPMITNKVSYMRWNQAWMMLAFTMLLQSEGINADSD